MIKKFVSKVLLYGIPFVIFIVIINYFGDCANLYNVGFEDKIIKIRNSGLNVTNINNYDERLVQRGYIEQMKTIPAVVVLGSSRSMLISSEYLNSPVLNLSVSGATIQDYIAMYWILKKQNKLPQKIIINVDPWLLTENLAQIRWKSLEKEYNEFNGLNELKMFEEFFKYQQLFSFSYFQCSSKQLFQTKQDPIGTNSMFNSANTVLPDGSIVYGEKYRNTLEKEVIQSVTELISTKGSILNHNGAISDKLLNEFSNFITKIKADGVSISFFLAPYHPLIYDHQAKNGNGLKKFEDKITAIGVSKSIEILGTFNPHKLPINYLGFFDGIHCKNETIKWILTNK
jgi:hypothetical protein